MSPEQVVGDRTIDARADVYAVGCLAYWMVTGELVFSGRTAIETLIHHTQTLPLPPSQRTELAIPLLLDQLILACLQKNADDRPASADVLLARLADIKTDAEWTPERSLQWWELRSPRKAPMA